MILNEEVRDHAFRHNYTARTQLHTDYGDAAAAFFEGAADAPLVFPTIDVVPIAVSPKEIYQLQSPIKITPRYYRRRTVAGLLTVPVGEWIFRAASRYDQPLGSARKSTTWSGQSVAGVERSFAISENTVTFVLQGSMVQKPRTASLISIQDLFDKAILLGVRWPLNDDWTILASGLRSGEDDSSLYGAEVTRTFASQWSVKASAQILEGPPQSVLGVYDQNDRIALEISRAF